MADADLVPELFGAESDFKAGTEWPWVNRALNLCAGIRSRFGRPDFDHFTVPIRALSWLIGRFGNEAGGVIFRFRGYSQPDDAELGYAVSAVKNGGRIPSVLAGIAAEKILHGARLASGLVRQPDWISGSELANALQARELQLWRMDLRKEWRPVETFA
jgi:hypothetical protein